MKKLKGTLLLFSPLFCLLLGGYEAFSQDTNTPELYLEPIFKVNYGDATADKPQSKSWTNEHGQWLVVGDEDGPKLLKKDALGWTGQSAVNRAWQTLPSRADVWSKGDEVQIVFVGECALNVVQMRYSKHRKGYKQRRSGYLPIPKDCNDIETATITQDSKNQFWVCADMNGKIMVWHSSNGKDWSEPFTLADDINNDDISLIVTLKGQVSVIWSNQNTQSINERIHIDGDDPDQWSEPIVVQEGDNNADDHLNATVFENGEMAMATKNSVDVINQPQFVLRFRDTKGQWTNIPYENLRTARSPSRPIINHIRQGRIFEVHTVRNRVNNRYFISVNEIIRKGDGWEFKELIQLKTEINGKNGDVTSSKAGFLPDEPKLIFFSDDLGHIYSFDLDTIL
ncbi:hypothetical protein HZY62_17505 [Maribacter polysiphoniae]|uniref:BNR repeat neuraminidase n=1 Tax=Maribacter polysiphoniae TaxID=429344 RepID=A0A316ESH7_9FLAO|nr:hypothetical protein [Maribacter polysiphoniae]MBD1262399.1 hypothetical protein [Maribacter polysiphoniae]PWK26100.1 hypothetical protein LX92_00844 [Maribacter polysiphoniae]